MPGILQHHAEALAQVAAVKVPDVVAVQQNFAGIHIIEPHEQLDHCGLARAGGADDGDLLAGLDIAAEIVDDGLFRRVAELYMVKRDLTVDAGRVGAASWSSSGSFKNSKTRSAAAVMLCSMLDTCASCWMGWVKFLTYWMNA